MALPVISNNPSLRQVSLELNHFHHLLPLAQAEPVSKQSYSWPMICSNNETLDLVRVIYLGTLLYISDLKRVTLLSGWNGLLRLCRSARKTDFPVSYNLS